MSEDALKKVYAAGNRAELETAYAEWATDYDRSVLSSGYCLPFAIAAWLTRYVRDLDAAILDVGCGSGLTGPLLAALGYRNVDGLDMSEPMLAIARQRGTYRSLVNGVLGEPLPLADYAYAAILSTGVFTQGHAPSSGLEELTRICAPGGHLVVTVRTSILETGGFLERFEQMTTEGWMRLERSAPFRAFVLDEPEVLAEAFVFQKPAKL